MTQSDEPDFVKEWRRKSMRGFAVVTVTVVGLTVITILLGREEIGSLVSLLIAAIWVSNYWRTSKPIREWARKKTRQNNQPHLGRDRNNRKPSKA